MEWVDPTHMMVLLVVLAAAAALWFQTATAVSRARRRRRDRRIFAVGFTTGWVAARVLRGHRRPPNAIAHLVRPITRSVADVKARALTLAEPVTRGSVRTRR